MVAVLVLYWSSYRHRLGALRDEGVAYLDARGCATPPKDGDLRSDAMAVEKIARLATRARGERVTRFNATDPKIARAVCPACARATSDPGNLLSPFGGR